MKEVVLLDGGLGQEVYKRSGKPAHPLWSAQVMIDSPHIVREVHEDFIQAGASVLTINSYTATPTRLSRDGNPKWFESLQIKALDLAQQARDNSGKHVQIAGCLPPLIGSYTTDERTIGELKEEYDRIVAIQAQEVDLFIAETIPSIQQAKAVVAAALESGKPVLLSVTLSDDTPAALRSGETLEDVVNEMADSGIAGLMFNCSYPETISKGISSIAHLDLPIGGYANAFTSVDSLKAGGTVDVLEARKDLDEGVYANHVIKWVKNGVSIVGGCCEVGPSHIRKVHERLKEEGIEPGKLERVMI